MPPREPSEQTDGKLIRKRTAELLIFFAQDGITNIGTHLKDNTIWPTQKLLAKPYDATRESVAQHLQKIYDSYCLNSVRATQSGSGLQGLNVNRANATRRLLSRAATIYAATRDPTRESPRAAPATAAGAAPEK